jgi:uroporphyrinogen decarboxylase
MAVRKKVTFLELCKTPELAAEVTIQPIDYLNADAAILFSDILTPVEPMGLKLDFVPGPVFENPVRTEADIDALRIPVMEEDVPYVLETIKILRREFEGRVPLIGFGGAPFTLACYMVEGKGSKDFAQIKRLMYGAPELYAKLMDKITEMDRQYLNAQIAAGAQTIQIFDTWGGIVTPLDYEKYILPYTKKLIDGLDRTVPIIHFVKGAGTMLDTVAKAGSDVMGLDWHVNLGKARDVIGPDIAVQGNLDPTILYAPKQHIEREVKRILDENAGRPGHIFNLGHGILPTVDPEHAKFMVECVHKHSGK